MAGIAGRDHGIVARGELLDAGLSAAGIARRVQKGLLFPEYRGVWCVGQPASTREARYMAAVKAGPADALLAEHAAAHVWGLVKGTPPQPRIVSSHECKVPGLRARRCRGLAAADGARWKSIPITTVPRTLVDLAPLLPLDALARACHEAGVLHRTTPRQVEAVLKRRPNSPGAAKLRVIIRGGEPVALSKLERAFVRLLREQRLPLQVTNRRAGSKRVDCRWPEHRLTVELDSFRFHNSRYSWEQDYRRERDARDRGDEFRRFTWADVSEDPSYMLRELRELLAG